MIVTTILKRYDLSPNDPHHHDLTTLNEYIKELANRMDSVYLIDLSILKINEFTTHGLHLSTKGKNKLSYLVVQKLQEIIKRDTLIGLSDGEKSANPIAYCRIDENLENSHFVQVVDGSIDYEIKKHCSNPQVAFAHSISRDKHISAGVTKICRENFGRPTASDYASKNLVCQQLRNGAPIYDLITKQ